MSVAERLLHALRTGLVNKGWVTSRFDIMTGIDVRNQNAQVQCIRP